MFQRRNYYESEKMRRFRSIIYDLCIYTITNRRFNGMADFSPLPYLWDYLSYYRVKIQCLHWFPSCRFPLYFAVCAEYIVAGAVAVDTTQVQATVLQ